MAALPGRPASSAVFSAPASINPARDRLFERFEQGEQPQGVQPVGGGAGLGLAIVNEICVMHGGSVEVDPTVTGFTIRLPARQTDARQDPLDAAP
jgi:signal transduction histidine kinase